MATTIRKIQEMNDEGVKKINECRYRDAKEIFFHALQHNLKLQTNEKQRQSESDEIQEVNHQQCSQEEQCNSIQIEIEDSMQEHRKMQSSILASSDCSFIYRNALKTVSITKKDSSDEGNRKGARDCEDKLLLQDLICLNGVLVFNLGLAHHCLAIDKSITRCRSKKTPLFGLKKALSMYKLAWGLLQNQRQKRMSISSISTTQNLDMAVIGMVNNMGAIHHEICNYSKAKRCFDILRNMMFNTSGSTKAAKAMQSQIPDVLTGIILNSVFLKEPSAAQAA